MREKQQDKGDEESIRTAKTLFGKFLYRYAFHFGSLTERDGLPEWKEWVDTTDWETLKTALDELAKENERSEKPAKPKSQRVMAMYFRIEKLKRKTEPDKMYARLPCGVCHTSGLVQLVYSYTRKRTIHPSEYEGENIGIEWGPCACVHGRNRYPKLSEKQYQLSQRCGFGRTMTMAEIEKKLRVVLLHKQSQVTEQVYDEPEAEGMGEPMDLELPDFSRAVPAA
jgi:hypothetical protein